MTEQTFWQQWQLKNYGNILPQTESTLEVLSGNEEDTRLTTAEENYIFSLSYRTF